MDNRIICDINLFSSTNCYVIKDGENKCVEKIVTSIPDICYMLENLILSTGLKTIHLYCSEVYADEIIKNIQTRKLFNNDEIKFEVN